MTIIQLNISFPTLFLVSLPKFWSVLNTLFLIFGNAAGEFLWLYILIVLTLLANFFRNLIYKVLNLGLMSIFVAALWSLSTDLTFIYVVYVLAFVGAVVMLFLSVILMLPASAVTTRHFGFLLLQSAQTREFFTFGGDNIWNFIAIAVFIGSLSIGKKFFFSFLRNNPSTKIPNKKVNLTTPLQKYNKNDTTAVTFMDQSADNNFRDYIKNHDFYTHKSNEANLAQIGSYTFFDFYDKRPVTITTAFRDSSKASFFLIAVPKVQNKKNIFYKMLAVVLYEFGDYYIRVIEPKFYKVHAGSNNFFVRFTTPLRTFVGAPSYGARGDLRSNLLGNNRRLALVTADSVSKKVVIIIPFTPWWSPFSIARLFTNVKLFYYVKFYLTNIWMYTHSVSSFIAVTKIHLDYLYKLVVSKQLLDKIRIPKTDTRVLLALYNDPKAAPAYSFIWFIHGIEYYIFKRVDSKLFASTSAHYFKSADYTSPVWSVLEKFYYPSQPARHIKFDTFPYNILPQITLYYEPLAFMTWVESMFPIILDTTVGRYRTNAEGPHIIYNKVLLAFNVIVFVLITFLVNIAHLILMLLLGISGATVELVVQTLLYVSVFMLAVPLNSTKSINSLLNFTTATELDNLAAIQHGLYVSNPVLLFVSVVGLLVALIGAATIVKQK